MLSNPATDRTAETPKGGKWITRKTESNSWTGSITRAPALILLCSCTCQKAFSVQSEQSLGIRRAWHVSDCFRYLSALKACPVNLWKAAMSTMWGKSVHPIDATATRFKHQLKKYGERQHCNKMLWNKYRLTLISNGFKVKTAPEKRFRNGC